VERNELAAAAADQRVELIISKWNLIKTAFAIDKHSCCEKCVCLVIKIQGFDEKHK
jgi:hypothetical protein